MVTFNTPTLQLRRGILYLDHTSYGFNLATVTTTDDHSDLQ